MTTTIENTPHRTESGLTPTEEARLLERALHPKRGWMRGQRFPTRDTLEEIEERTKDPKKATAIDKALKVVHDAMDSTKLSARLRGANVQRLMEMQNQKDDHAALRIFNDEPPPVEQAPTINQQFNIVVERAHEDDEYLEFKRAKLLGHSFKPGVDGSRDVVEQLATGSAPGAAG